MKNLALPLALAISSLPFNLYANETKIAELQEQINALADILENQTSYEPKTSVGGYGEMHYSNFEAKDNELDFHRFILFVTHKFDEKTRFFSELELEYSIAGAGQVGAIELEQAYIQFDQNKGNIKAGLFMLPIGIINETHEPPTFYGVERNPVEKYIVPATWWEGGAMYSGYTDNGFSYDIAFHSGLKNTSTTGSKIIRGGRQKVGKATANSWAYTGRIKYTGIAGLELSTSINQQEDMDQAAGGVGAGTLIQAHAIYQLGNVKVTALTANWTIDGLPNANGNYLEASYKVTPKVGVFARQNTWDADGSVSQLNAGVNYWPHEDVVVKFDIQRQNDAGFNIGLGYQF